MKLSNLIVDDLKPREPATTTYDDEFITKVVFDGIKDDLKNNEWCIVFGNSLQINERVKTIIEKYNEKRFEKIILCGGKSGISNVIEKNDVSEAMRMKNMLVNTNIPDENIYLEENSNNTFENIDNAFNIILKDNKGIDSISIISGEYHLKRCLLAINKKYPDISVTTIPSYDGYADKDNWYKSSNNWNEGRCMIIWERNLLTKYAKENKIVDIDIK